MRAIAAILGLCLALGATPAGAATELKFYYPVHLTGPLVKEVEALVADFHKAHPGIRVEPVWGGNYWQNMQKTVAALQAGNPPDVAVHLAVDVVTLRDLDAVVPLDPFVQREGGERFLEDFFPGFVNDLRADGKIWRSPSSAAPRSSTSTRTPCGGPDSTRPGPPPPGASCWRPPRS